jgi:hypothetical protein
VIVSKAGHDANLSRLHFGYALIPSSHLFRLILNKANIWAEGIPSNDLSQFRTEGQGHAFSIGMNKTGKKKSKKEDEKAIKKAPAQDAQPARDDDKALDFGGLPDRDLKKNLGCG